MPEFHCTICGKTIEFENQEELTRQANEHMQSQHNTNLVKESY